MSKIKLTVGIDLGTTNSECYIYSDVTKQPELQYLHGSLSGIYPSVVYYDKTADKFLVGERVKNNADLYMDAWKHMKIRMSEGEFYTEEYNGIKLNPQQFSSKVLEYIKEGLDELYPDNEIEDIVITVPAYFKDNERRSTENAARDAGFNPTHELRLINEPTSATLAYGEEVDEGYNVLAFDLGGGTFDATLLECENVDDVRFYQAVRTDGCVIGGKNFDEAISEFLYNTYIQTAEGSKYEEDAEFKKEFIKRSYGISEKIKISLSKQDEVKGVDMVRVQGQRIIVEYTISRTHFENMIAPLVVKTVETARKVVGGREIQRIILVGGSTRIPLVGRMINDAFPDVEIEDKDPDLIVARGAAIQASIMGNKKESFLNEILTNPLGITVAGGFVSYMMLENTPIPYEVVERFYTANKGQKSVTAYVVQGKDINVEGSENQVLGKIVLENFHETDEKIPVDVTLRVDNSGKIGVTAKEVHEDGAEFFDTFQIGKTASVQKANFGELVKAANTFFKNNPREKLKKAEEEILGKLLETETPIATWIIDRLENQEEFIKSDDEYRALLYRAIQAINQGL